MRRGRRIKTRTDAFRPNDDQFARLHIALVSCADQVEGASFRGEDDGVALLAFERRNAPHGERTEAAWIACRDNAVGTHHHQRKRAFHAPQRVGNRFGQSMFPRKRNQMHDHFGIAVRLKDRSLALQAAANFLRIDQVAVVRDCDRTFIRLHKNRLSIQ